LAKQEPKFKAIIPNLKSISAEFDPDSKVTYSAKDGISFGFSLTEDGCSTLSYESRHAEGKTD